VVDNTLRIVKTQCISESKELDCLKDRLFITITQAWKRRSAKTLYLYDDDYDDDENDDDDDDNNNNNNNNKRH
jgi:hypothetical protein